MQTKLSVRPSSSSWLKDAGIWMFSLWGFLVYGGEGVGGHCCTAPGGADSAADSTESAGSKTTVKVSHENVDFLYFPSHWWPRWIPIRSLLKILTLFLFCEWLHHQSTHAAFSFRTFLWHIWPQKPFFPSVPECTTSSSIAIKHQLFSLSFLSTNINCFLIELLFLRFSSSLLSSNQTLIVLKETQTGRSLTCPAWDNARLCKRSV